MPYQNNMNQGRSYTPSNSAPSQEPKIDVNTNGICFRNLETTKYMNVTYWDYCVAIEIGLLDPNKPQDYRTMKPRVRQVFSFFDIANLQEVCEEVLESIKTSKQFSSVGVRVGSAKNNIIMVSNGSEIGQPSGIYLVIYKTLDASNQTREIEFYPFQGQTVVREYNAASGSIKEDKNMVREFKDFVLIIKEAAKAFTNAQAHVYKKAKHADALASLKMLSAIALKNGVDPAEASLKATSADPAGARTPKNTNYGRSGGWNNSNRNGGYQNTGYSERYNNQPKFTSSQSPNRSVPFETPQDMSVDINLDPSQLSTVPF